MQIIDGNIIKTTNSGKNILVYGAGAWGTALANFLSKYNDVSLYVKDKDQYLDMQNSRFNNKYLSGIKLKNNLNLLNDVHYLQNFQLIIIAVPSHALIDSLNIIQEKLNNNTNVFIAWLCKGFIYFNDKIYLPHELFEKILPQNSKIGVLTGPSFALEVAQDLPFALTAASKNLEWQEFMQNNLHQQNLRIYTSHDVVGCELGGALKNILAIAVGIADGLNLGLNAQAALITRGMQELIRIGNKLGADINTMFGLAGLGDLILTCTGHLSRNRQFGIKIGQGYNLKEVLNNSKNVVEGVNSTKFAYNIAIEYKIDVPIIEAVYNILFNDKTPEQIINSLLSRKSKHEFFI